MAKKKYRKRPHSSAAAARKRTEQERLTDEKDRAKKRWNPAGRALLYVDLVLLAVCALLDANGLISPLVNGLCTIVGVVLLITALWLLFGKKHGGNSLGKGPRL